MENEEIFANTIQKFVLMEVFCNGDKDMKETAEVANAFLKRGIDIYTTKDILCEMVDIHKKYEENKNGEVD